MVAPNHDPRRKHRDAMVNDLRSALEDTGVGREAAKSYIEREIRGRGREATADRLDKAASTVDSQRQQVTDRIEAMRTALNHIEAAEISAFDKQNVSKAFWTWTLDLPADIRDDDRLDRLKDADVWAQIVTEDGGVIVYGISRVAADRHHKDLLVWDRTGEENEVVMVDRFEDLSCGVNGKMVSTLELAKEMLRKAEDEAEGYSDLE
jgi:hypothetical protein